MGKQAKRTRTTAKKTAASSITIREEWRGEGSYGYQTYLVQGWKENGKWMRKRFKIRQKAENFAALKRIEVENTGRAQSLVLSHLTEQQHEEARQAFDKLGKTYTLTQAVDYFLKMHRPPDHRIRLADALKTYLDYREHDGLRSRTLKAIKSVVQQFTSHADDPWVHEIGTGMVDKFLTSLRAKDGKSKATRKTWNNYRNDLHGFFEWCGVSDATTNRPFLFENPVATVRKFSARQVREDQDAKPATTSVGDVQRIFSTLLRWRKGTLVRHFAFLYFAGIRPEELKRLAPRERELVNLTTRTITIPAKVSKTGHERQVLISENLAAWLEIAPAGIMPTNFDRLAKKVRKHFELTHDEPRHSFISYHVAVHRSVGDAALQAGNSESIVKRHYLNTHSREEGASFFQIVPSADRRAPIMREMQKASPIRSIA